MSIVPALRKPATVNLTYMKTSTKNNRQIYICFFSALAVGYGLGLITTNAQPLSKNKEVVRKYLLEVVSNKRLDLLETVAAKNRIAHFLNDNTDDTGIEQLREFLQYLFKAFPDLYYTIGDLIEENDKVAARVIFHGTHKGEFMGIPASNNRIDYLSEVFFFRIKDGKIVEQWTQLDLQTLSKKLKGE